MTSLKLTLASLAAATALLACAAATSTDDVDVDVEASQLGTNACSKSGCPPPPPTPTSTCVKPDGGPKRVTYPNMGGTYEVSPIPGGGVKGGVRVYGGTAVTATPTSTFTTVTGVNTAVVGDFVVGGDLVVAPDPGNPDELTFHCEGTNPDGFGLKVIADPPGSENYICVAGCVDDSNGTPQGITALSAYVCPSAYPVNRCDPWHMTCTCSKQ